MTNYAVLLDLVGVSRQPLPCPSPTPPGALFLLVVVVFSSQNSARYSVRLIPIRQG